MSKVLQKILQGRQDAALINQKLKTILKAISAQDHFY